MARSASLAVVALLAVGCGDVSVPSAPTPPVAAHGVPARVELNATPGIGATGGTATITARVLDAYAALLADQAVTFTTSAGTLSQASATTNAEGIARTTLTAPAGTAMVTARAGAIETTPLPIAVQPVVLPPSTPPSEPPAPPQQPDPQPTGPLSVTMLYTAGLAGSPTSFALAMQGGLSSAQWTFGDNTAGLTTSVATAAHVYVSPGTYTASVTVRDQAGRTASDTKTITIGAGAPTPGPPPPPAPSYTMTLAAAPTSVIAGGTATLTANVVLLNGATAPTSYAWDCNGDALIDATTPGNTNVCTYALAGVYTARVSVTNGSISSNASTTVTVTPAPVPSYTLTLSASPTTVQANGGSTTLTATVTPTGGAPPAASIAFDCGGHGAVNPAPGLSLIATCAYTTPGPVTARVTATNGAISGTLTTPITVSPAPVPVITVNCSNSTSSTTTPPGTATSCNVSAKLGGVSVLASNITVTAWEWGDGANGGIGTGAAALIQSHTYTSPSGGGGYTVVVIATVTGGGGPGTGSGTTIVQ